MGWRGLSPRHHQQLRKREKQGRGVDVTGRLCPPGCCDGAAGEGAANGLHPHFLQLYESPEIKGGHGGAREVVCRARQVPGLCECIPHEARAPCWD